MKTNWHQQEIKYTTLTGKEMMAGTFWVDDEGEVDVDNLPSDKEICVMLKALKYNPRGVQVEATGISVSE